MGNPSQLPNGMDVAMLGHVSAATTMDIYTHITDDMQRTAAANIDRGIGKAAPQGRYRVHQSDQRPPLRGTLLAHVD